MTARADSNAIQAKAACNSGGAGLRDEIVPSLNGRSVSPRRLLGAYYTPDVVAEVLARWALNDATGNLLDPSFGGCAFMEAGAKVMAELGSKVPGAKVFGVDIDASCAEYVRRSSMLREQNCTFADFLALTPADLPGAPFQAVVGNPPYVRHHWVRNEKRALARRIADESSVELADTASLWAYFVVHTLAFIAQGGRLALLVPEAILQANYAGSVREVLEASFRRTRLVHLRERLFDGTDESVVVIAAEGLGEPGTLSVHSLENVRELAAFLRGIEVVCPHTTLAKGRRVSQDALEAVDLVLATNSTNRFDTLATARIGIVTGANSHFIRTADELKEFGVPARARAGIVSRTKWLSGLEFTAQDHQDVAASGSRAFLVRPTPALEEEPGVVRWVAAGEAAGVDKRHKCAERDPWFRVGLPPRPDAFVTSTRIASPLLVLNRTSYRCTNTLYSVRLNPRNPVSPECIALGFLTTFVALWAELNGRRYGGGVLKLDLGTLAELPVPIVPDCTHAFVDANRALRDGDEDRARQIADNAVLRIGLGISEAAIRNMRRAHRDLVRQRIPDSKVSG